jgi:hypothetical protein
MIDLRTADVKKGTLILKTKKFFFQITDKNVEKGQKSETVRVAFDSEEEFDLWGKVFAESMKSDEKLLS